MPYTSEERRKNVQRELRDAHGYFISRNPKVQKPPQTNTSSQSQTTSPPPVDTPSKQNTANADSLVSLNIKNPLTLLTRSFTKAINKPITIKIPPIWAAPILISFGVIPFSFFGLGKVVQKQEIAALPTPTPIVIVQPTATPAPVLVSRIGTIKATYQVTALLSPTTPVILSEPSITRGAEGSLITPTESSPTPVPARFVLVKGEDITFLIVPSEINLSYYLNRKVLITGLYDKMTDTLKISKSGDIEVLP